MTKDEKKIEMTYDEKKIIAYNMFVNGGTAREVMDQLGLSSSATYRIKKAYETEKSEQERELLITALGKKKPIGNESEKLSELPITELVKKITESVSKEEAVDFAAQKKKDYDLSAETLYKHFESYVTAFKAIDKDINSHHEIYEEIGQYNKDQQILLHKLEDANTDEEAFEITKALYELRRNRRLAKNEQRLIIKLRSLFKMNKVYTNVLLGIAESIERDLKIIREFTFEASIYCEDNEETEEIDQENELETMYIVKEHQLVEKKEIDVDALLKKPLPKEQELAPWQMSLKNVVNGNN